MTNKSEHIQKLKKVEEILGYTFKDSSILLAALTHPSAAEGRSISDSYERLEFLGDSILGAIVAYRAYHNYPELDEGGLTRIKVSLVSGSSLAKVAEGLGFADVIIFGSSETGTGRRGLHSALENVYEAVVAALYLDGGLDPAVAFVEKTLIINMSPDMAKEPENPKSVLQERLQEDGITPTYRLVETQGPPHDRTFVTQVLWVFNPWQKVLDEPKRNRKVMLLNRLLRHSAHFLMRKIQKIKSARRMLKLPLKRQKQRRRLVVKPNAHAIKRSNEVGQ